MSKIIRLKSHEMREWSRNVSMLVDENGNVIRPVSAKETMTMMQVSKHVAATKKPVQVKTPEEPTMVEARIVPLPGTKQSVIKFFIDNLEVKGGREIMRDRLLAEHGTCHLHAMNGKLIAVVRDPRGVQVPSTPSVAVARGVPSADSCLCQQWSLSNGSPHPGKHHPICQYNEHAPPQERGSFEEDGGTPAQAPVQSQAQATVQVSRQAPAAQQTPVAPPPEPVPAPQDCYCKKWNLPDGSAKPADQHHPICEHKDKWEAQNKATYYLVDLDTIEVKREASADEVQEAESNEAVGGVLLCHIGDKTYGLMLQSEIQETLAAQQDGETESRPESD